jgi:N-acetyl-anhydromuramyl-L-alanine amidase AmpD
MSLDEKIKTILKELGVDVFFHTDPKTNTTVGSFVLPKEKAKKQTKDNLMYDLKLNDKYLIPIEKGQAVGKGWKSRSGYKPMGVTWHWTAGWDLERGCSKILGGANASRKGKASAHFGVGRSFDEGIDRYVTIENRSWHAGANQTLRWDGKPCVINGVRYSGASYCIGIETVNVGYARKGVKAKEDWSECASANGTEYKIQPWTEEQIEMMIALGKHIQEKWSHLTWEDHHDHQDLCAGYKTDSIGFPFARVLRGVYNDPSIPDVWSPFLTNEQRQQALIDLGYDLGKWGADGDWGRMSDSALRDFQELHGMVENGMWTTFVSKKVYTALEEKGLKK